MESNGKRVSDRRPGTGPTRHGTGTVGARRAPWASTPFHQLLHQGQLLCPADFVLPLTHPQRGNHEQHRNLVANCLAQSRAMMVGRTLVEEATHGTAAARIGRARTGRRGLPRTWQCPAAAPTALSPWRPCHPPCAGRPARAVRTPHLLQRSGYGGINSFDQWGVELGKEIGATILGRLEGGAGDAMDPATERLIEAWKAAQG